VSHALDILLELLDLEQIEENIFRGQNEPGRGTMRLFGGQVAAQSLAAAGRTVEGRRPHSLHAYFLRGGDPAVPIVFNVDRIRDGSSFTTRRVVAIQRGRAIFNMSVSFHKDEMGYEHQIPMPEAPAPEAAASWDEPLAPDDPALKAMAETWAAVAPEEYAQMRAWMERERAIEARSDEPRGWLRGEPRDGLRCIWIRAKGRLGDDPMAHACVLTYASDMSLVDTAYRPHRHSGPRDVMMASLDHAMWFHRPFRVDEWLLYTQDSPAAAGARGFARGMMYTRDGTLVCSVAQEGLIRQIDPRRAAKVREAKASE
jgi:acyl-CoA thioesterase-2